MARRNSGEISRNSGVISRNSGVIVWTESSAGFDIEKLFQLRVLTGTMSSATLLGGAVLRQALKKHGEQPTL